MPLHKSAVGREKGGRKGKEGGGEEGREGEEKGEVGNEREEGREEMGGMGRIENVCVCMCVCAHACTHGIEMSVHNARGQLRVNRRVSYSQLQPRQGTASLC